jgi:hypothetical protein
MAQRRAISCLAAFQALKLRVREAVRAGFADREGDEAGQAGPDCAGWGAADKAANLGRCKSSFRQLPGFGRIAYPLQGEVTSSDRRGCKSHGCQAPIKREVGATGVASKPVGLNISK